MHVSQEFNEAQVIRLPEVSNRTQLGKSTIYRLIRQGKFPRNFKLSPDGRSSGWLLSDVNRYINSCADGLVQR